MNVVMPPEVRAIIDRVRFEEELERRWAVSPIRARSPMRRPATSGSTRSKKV
jgi:hypothetical protein